MLKLVPRPMLVLAAWLLLGCSPRSPVPSPATARDVALVLFHGGEIVTMQPSRPVVEAVVANGARIVFVGDEDDAVRRYGDAERVDLGGATMMPGFIEQHLHPFLGALTLALPVIAPEAWELPAKTWPAVRGNGDYVAALAAAERAMTDPGETLWSWGYHPDFHGDLDRTVLDGISDTRPIGVWHRSCHEFYLNSALLRQLDIDQASVDAAGPEVAAQIDLATGHFYENGALIYLLPRILPDLANPVRFRRGLKQMVEMLHGNGVTAFNEPGSLITPAIAALYVDVLGAPSAPMYSYFIPESKTPFHMYGAQGVLAAVEATTELLPDSGKIRFFDRHVKLLMDGAIISQLMQMRDGYLDGHPGEWIQAPEEVDEVTRIFWDAGYQIHIHVNGDLALDKLLDILEQRMRETPRVDHRTTIVHFANSTEEQVERIAALGAIVSANPYYVTGFADRFSEIGLGPERARAMVRLAPLEKAGVSVSLHSDLPMAPADPLYLAWSAVTRRTNDGNVLRPDLALSVDAALRAITIDAAYSWRMESQIGSIVEGKIANFTILRENPYEVDPERWKDIDVVATVFEGEVYPLRHARPVVPDR